ncbi:MAG TPA: muconolactone Delta-isomerase family protein [Opitutaceae bacterium]
MRILAIERDLPAPPAPNIKELLRAEAACVWDLQKRGIIRDIWFTVEGHNAVIMLECRDATEARQHLATLPLVQAGAIDFSIQELRSYDGYERLFATEDVPSRSASGSTRKAKS